MSDPVVVACHCPGTPHDNDEFFLADELPIEAGIAAAAALASSEGGNAAAVLIGALLRNGAIVGWNLVDDNGDSLPVNPLNISRRVTWLKGGVELSNAALARYVTADSLAPFGLSSSASRNGTSSRGGRTGRSTSRKTPSSPTPPEPSE